MFWTFRQNNSSGVENGHETVVHRLDGSMEWYVRVSLSFDDWTPAVAGAFVAAQGG
jgi:hypothetical protein